PSTRGWFVLQFRLVAQSLVGIAILLLPAGHGPHGLAVEGEVGTLPGLAGPVIDGLDLLRLAEAERREPHPLDAGAEIGRDLVDAERPGGGPLARIRPRDPVVARMAVAEQAHARRPVLMLEERDTGATGTRVVNPAEQRRRDFVEEDDMAER